MATIDYPAWIYEYQEPMHCEFCGYILNKGVLDSANHMNHHWYREGKSSWSLVSFEELNLLARGFGKQSEMASNELMRRFYNPEYYKGPHHQPVRIPTPSKRISDYLLAYSRHQCDIKLLPTSTSAAFRIWLQLRRNYGNSARNIIRIALKAMRK